MFKILIVEDEVALQTILKYDLENKYLIEICDDGQKGLDLLLNNYYDLAIIDWMLPNLDGLSIIKGVRKHNPNIKLLMLTARNEEMDIVAALEAGADDYVTKPFSPRELSARIKVLLKNITLNKDKHLIVLNENCILDIKKHEVKVNGNNIKLSKLEYNLLVYLIDNKNQVISRDQIMQHIWGYEYENDNRAVDVYIHSLKRKLELNKQIESKRGIGYILNLN